MRRWRSLACSVRNVLVDELQIQDSAFERDRAERERPQAATSCANAPDLPLSFSPPRFIRSPLRLYDHDQLLVARHREVQALAREALDSRMRGPCALLDLQASPIDLELVLLAIQLLELE